MDKTTNGLNAVLGALTADAAALGLHWLYNTDRLAGVAGDHVVFRQPRIELESRCNDFSAIQVIEIY